MSLATTVPRKQAARLAKPATRYWKGKAPQGLAEVQSDSDEEDEERDDAGEDVALDEREEEDEEEEGMTLRKGIEKTKAMNIALKDVSITNDGKVRVAGRDESGRTALEHAANADNDVEVADEDESEDDEESEEESSEEDSSEDEKPKVQFRPVFVPKRARVTVAEREKLAEDTEEALKRKEEEALQRKKESHDLVAESIKRELAEKEKEDDVPDVDDTDGLDPEGEFEAWRLRELGRIKKEKEAELEREQEREEIERRRALPEEQRLKEDMERAKQTRDEKPKGSQKFLQKYWHKGAFHQDMEVLKRHDYTEATESTVDVSVLPKLMQVRNFGKRSRTKYTHLLDQDTTASTGGFGGTGPVKAGGTSAQGGGCFLCGGPHLKKGKTVHNSPSILAGRITDLLVNGRSSQEMSTAMEVGQERMAVTMTDPEKGTATVGTEEDTMTGSADILHNKIGMKTSTILAAVGLVLGPLIGHTDLLRETATEIVIDDLAPDRGSTQMKGTIKTNGGV
ncbi:hypothetical protein D9611_003403 [Ephemerocybe angulata]|uniref:Micro-fibrillar-associated protein 1 C-terminal domain-containing protein n=1 Tax=Ephemerocybe angulata TaxID=980116 RepID=A0A8H5C975_9AGAR|nr:hypothetical protein D9611_003403 [Tulosesus angulatus]